MQCTIGIDFRFYFKHYNAHHVQPGGGAEPVTSNWEGTRIPVSEDFSPRVSLHVFRSVRRHLANANHCNTLRSASSIPSVQEAAAQAYGQAVDALLTELTRLDDKGVLDRIEAIFDEI